ncbi:MAG: hypothetical protein JO316_24675 [Abitibacteriaceae bacterium]|nr:hypothetical protein [Abditibacteriaceae bacterium]
MDKSVLEIKPLSEQGDARGYWAHKTPLERLEAVEFMCQVMYGYDPSTARLHRVLTVAQHLSRLG